VFRGTKKNHVSPITILGAGLTGLSAAYHLNRPYDVFEQDAQAGGLCRTMEREDFFFDYTGHLLHLRNDYTKDLIQHLLPVTFVQHSRKAMIYTQGRYLDYPFQANIHALSAEMVKECIIGFVETLKESPEPPSPLSFHEWVLQTFGAGIAKYFMLPYNQKLWRIPLQTLSADWVSWSIPKPTLDEFLDGALGIQHKTFGYNPTFFYPKTGGIDILPHSFEQQLEPNRLHYGKRAFALDVEARQLSFDDGSTVRYDTLISTLPLNRLLRLIHNLPEDVAPTAAQLSHIAVYDLNIGVNRADISDAHWLYFPEPEYPFYRVGFPSNFSHTVAPESCSSMYVEVSILPEETIPEHTLREQVFNGLCRSGILRDTDEILVCDIVRIDCAYVHYDLNRAQALATIFPYLEQHQIHSTGRYGSWEYSSMEDAILAGKAVAEKYSV
jgi:protoporphyrinogen oxidase